MPVISAFFGIVIKVFHHDHFPPHIHIGYAEKRAVVEISTGQILSGQLPKRVQRLVEEWRLLHRREIMDSWSNAQSGKMPRKIRPLE